MLAIHNLHSLYMRRSHNMRIQHMQAQLHMWQLRYVSSRLDLRGPNDVPVERDLPRCQHLRPDLYWSSDMHQHRNMRQQSMLRPIDVHDVWSDLPGRRYVCPRSDMWRCNLR